MCEILYKLDFPEQIALSPGAGFKVHHGPVPHPPLRFGSILRLDGSRGEENGEMHASS